MNITARSVQKLQTRDRLLSTAYNLFSQKGLAATRTIDVAQNAGIAHGTLFVHFPTRDDLLVEVITQFGITLGKRFQKLPYDQANLEQLLIAHLRVIQEFEQFYIYLVIEGAMLPEKIRNAIFMIQSGIGGYLEKAYQQEYKKNTVKQISLPLLLNSWLGLIHYYFMHKDLFAPECSLIEKYGNSLVQHFMKIISI